MRMFRLSIVLISIVTHALAASAQQVGRTNAVAAPVPAGSVTLPLAEYQPSRRSLDAIDASARRAAGRCGSGARRSPAAG